MQASVRRMDCVLARCTLAWSVSCCCSSFSSWLFSCSLVVLSMLVFFHATTECWMSVRNDAPVMMWVTSRKLVRWHVMGCRSDLAWLTSHNGAMKMTWFAEADLKLAVLTFPEWLRGPGLTFPEWLRMTWVEQQFFPESCPLFGDIFVHLFVMHICVGMYRSICVCYSISIIEPCWAYLDSICDSIWYSSIVH